MICPNCGNNLDALELLGIKDQFGAYWVCDYCGNVVCLDPETTYRNDGLWPYPCLICGDQVTVFREIHARRTKLRFTCPCGLDTTEERPTKEIDFLPSRSIGHYAADNPGFNQDVDDIMLNLVRAIHAAIGQVLYKRD